ncbi:quinohemoprotein amine dehydrogenase subunit alpha [Paremcibacter congregatus]|uniref:Quinohemoprotein amine dehydrogenase subunit alpha n=3 Tax=Paremcibacter congregatus TaxID=2043170 RepID=A0A2G4YMR0_9PROT|nr:quinohemoprotein amine dehydrogenase subunit alpha [Paremcibacter congregatus]QDE28326.1 quinohemoprotein amine dehydrogenase subunit alpha [Paremcibacter congregatus]
MGEGMLGKIYQFVSVMILMILSSGSSPALAEDMEGKALVNDYCTACHEVSEDGKLARISAVRKTPEGWDMTLFRMQHLHGLELESDERFAIIKYLSTEYGLAPSEAAPFRYVLEQRAHFVDTAVNDDLDALCGRCHTNARYGLQRRTEEDWLKHMHFHVGQFPSLEYQARSRDRFWWKEVTTETYKELATLYPFQAAAWAQWQVADHKSPVGKWRVAGHRPGVGLYQGSMTVSPDGDMYKVVYDLEDTSGAPLTGDSKVVIYTGYEWRGSGTLNNTETREVYALSEDGAKMRGRWYEAGHYDRGGEIYAVREKDAVAEVMALSSSYIRVGETKDISLYGVALSGDVRTSDPGLDVAATVQGATLARLKITAGKDLAPGRYQVQMGAAVADITVYDTLDSVRVFPEYTIARLGGGRTPPVSAQFEAYGYLNGPDATPGTADDIRVGLMPASWEAQPFNEEAAHMKDVNFAGRLSDTGRYLPASAGPNPDRKFATNNAGNLKIVATVKDTDQLITGDAQLIVTVQRWNSPPIR